MEIEAVANQGLRKTGISCYRGAARRGRCLAPCPLDNRPLRRSAASTPGRDQAANFSASRGLTGNLVIGAKVRADFAPAHNVPQSDAQKWRNSVAVVPFAAVCCTFVPGLLPRLRNLERPELGQAEQASGHGVTRGLHKVTQRKAILRFARSG